MTSVPATRPAEDPEEELLTTLVQLFDAEPSWVVEDAMNGTVGRNLGNVRHG